MIIVTAQQDIKFITDSSTLFASPLRWVWSCCIELRQTLQMLHLSPLASWSLVKATFVSSRVAIIDLDLICAQGQNNHNNYYYRYHARENKKHFQLACLAWRAPWRWHSRTVWLVKQRSQSLQRTGGFFVGKLPIILSTTALVTGSFSGGSMTLCVDTAISVVKHTAVKFVFSIIHRFNQSSYV